MVPDSIEELCGILLNDITCRIRYELAKRRIDYKENNYPKEHGKAILVQRSEMAEREIRMRRSKVNKTLLLTIIMAVMLLHAKDIYQEIKMTPPKEKIAMAGSTSMELFANALAEGFMNQHPHITVTAEFTGSSAGIEAVLAGSVDIGNSSRYLTGEEKAAGAVEYIAAIDSIVIVTDVENPVRELTKEQLCGIYHGTVRNWGEVGGRDTAIVVVGREAGSGTREAFEEFLGMRDECVYANELNSAGAVLARVSSTPGAIGYVSWDVLNDTVSVMALDGVMPSAESIRAGEYGLSRPYILVTRGRKEEQSEAVQKLFDYLDSEEGKALLGKVGLLMPK